jgi:trk system potassium uptake protein TrkA
MFALILGGGKVGTNLTRALLEQGHEAVVVEQRDSRYARLAEEFGPAAVLGDATELNVLEEAGIGRPPDMVIAVTGDDEDNVVICQLARDTYGVTRIIARVNDPRNQSYFDLLDISPTVSATQSILSLIEHEVPEHRLVHLLELKQADIEVVEVLIEKGSLAAGCTVEDLDFPQDVRLTAVIHNDGRGEIVSSKTELHAGDQVVAVLVPGQEAVLRSKFAARD